MAATSQGSSRFAGIKKKSIKPELDVDGRVKKVETREDEEQNVKLLETVDLLLAAGYFRARIKGLSPFDKVVGGMTWCITSCDIDLDVDLLFQENSTIGQKIALTEKIVAVLPKMKCPHRLEPHQIQGLDFIHIFPVVQWLVKKAIETREEMGDYIREFSVSQFNKSYSTPQDAEFDSRKEKCKASILGVKNTYKPKRMYKKPGSLEFADEETRVKTTLLEYGWQLGYSKEQKEKDGKKSGKKTPSTEGGRPKSGSMDSIDEEYVIEQKRINSLMSNMAAMQGREGSLSSSMVGSIVGLQSEEISQMASEYAEKQAELQEGSERNERTSGAQAHKRMLASLEKQIANQEKKLAQVEERHAELQQACAEAKEVLAQKEEYGQKIKEEMQALTELEKGENVSIYQKLRYLVAMNENLKKQEHQFKAQCKEQLEKLKNNIENLKDGVGEENEDEESNVSQYDVEDDLNAYGSPVHTTEAAVNALRVLPAPIHTRTQERARVIEQQYEADKQKLQKIRLALAKKNREIAVLQRKIDEVPSRAELSQYQRRFVELYNQVAATHKETKQFYTFYNTLDDTKLYLEKEVTLLNSIHDNFYAAMSSPATKTQFLQQFEQIVNGVLKNKSKVEERKSNEKKKRDELNEQFLSLVEKQRQYFKTVKEFQEECRKNEILLSKIKGHQG